jgi:solute:Na+ symporter, SSS family
VTKAGPVVIREHFGGSAFKLSELGFDTKLTVYAGFLAVGLNLLVAALVTIGLRAAGVAGGTDSTRASEYTADRGDPRVGEVEEAADPAH